MQPLFARGNRQTVEKRQAARRQALADKTPHVALRIQGILLSLDGHTTGEIACRLRVHRSTVPLWIDHWNQHGELGLWGGHRRGRPCGLAPVERQKLADIFG
jgi:transposase